MNILVTGSTGLVGAEVVRQAIKDNDILGITALVRKPMDIHHPKLTTIIHHDFLDYSLLAPLFNQTEACLWCLGVSQSQVGKEQYHTITFDFTLAAAKAMLAVNPSIRFLFVSGNGADPTGKSCILFARIKGKTENALLDLPFQKLFIVRPGGIRPIHRNKNTALVNKIMIPFFPLLEWLAPSIVINSVQLAKAMLHIVKNGAEKTILENKDLKEIARVHGS